ncbi:TPA: hypothetical protein ACX6SV_003449, partial [Photobacterium damselae]
DFRQPLAPSSVSVRSHYRDFDHIGKGIFAKNLAFLAKRTNKPQKDQFGCKEQRKINNFHFI